ncbi:hypothetical protein DEO72_LG11g2578 [Vigna unguiculata]|uniref:Uncharacterized protein n=1 Tax=Vigna unguiculata TaxID=3917 RepID=A0A4D6NUV1_VIGUN|nr:hypothetical protein DEO72_LG11g2578 [Vigna unguiculata]
MRSQLITNLPARDLIRTHPGPTKNLVLKAQRLAQQPAATKNKTPTLPRQLSSGTTSLTAWRHTQRCQAPGFSVYYTDFRIRFCKNKKKKGNGLCIPFQRPTRIPESILGVQSVRVVLGVQTVRALLGCRGKIVGGVGRSPGKRWRNGC